jgi:hypothetical protein
MDKNNSIIMAEEFKEYIECSCHSEGIQVWHEREFKMTYLSLFSLGMGRRKMPWRTRLRCIWKLIKEGTCFNDQLILDETGLIRLRQVLTECETANLQQARIEGKATIACPTAQAALDKLV